MEYLVYPSETISNIESKWNRDLRPFNETVFHSYEWWSAISEHLVPNPDFFFFTFYDKGVLVGVIPLEYKRGRKNGIPSAYWSTIWHPHTTLQYAIVTPGYYYDVWKTLQAALKYFSDIYPWDYLDVNSYLADSNEFWQEVARNFEQHNKHLIIDQVTTSMYFDTSGTYEDAVVNEVKGNQKNLRRQLRVLGDMGEVGYYATTGGTEEAKNALKIFLDLENSGWKGNECTSILCDEHLVKFYQKLYNNNKFRIYWMTVGGEPAAAAIVGVGYTQLNFIKIAYDEKFSKGSPSNQLLSDSLRELCSEYCYFAKLSLTTGPKWAKDRWRPKEIPVDSFTLFNYNSGYSQVLWFVDQKIKPFIKKLIRR